MLDLRQRDLAEWQKKNFPDQELEWLEKSELIEIIKKLQCATGMAEEAGEVCHHILKGVQGIRGGVNGINKKEVADGVADTLIYGLQLLSLLGLDAEDEIEKVIHNVMARNWQKNKEGQGAPVQGGEE